MKAGGWAASATATGSWGRPRRRSITTCRPWPSPAKPATATGKAPGWAASAAFTGSWGRPRRRSITTCRPWPSPAKPATAAGKPLGWAASVTATGSWGRPRRRSSTTCRPWPSPAKPATAAGKACSWAASATATRPWGRPRRRSSTTSTPLRSVTTPGTRRFRPRPASASHKSTCTRKNGLKPGNSQKPLPAADTGRYWPMCSPRSGPPICARVTTRTPTRPFPMRCPQRTLCWQAPVAPSICCTRRGSPAQDRPLLATPTRLKPPAALSSRHWPSPMYPASAP